MNEKNKNSTSETCYGIFPLLLIYYMIFRYQNRDTSNLVQKLLPKLKKNQVVISDGDVITVKFILTFKLQIASNNVINPYPNHLKLM